MSNVYQLILFLKSLAPGMMAPVLTLTLLAHGASIKTLSLLLGAYSFTVIVAEFPSGLLADLWGRKKTFLLSTTLHFLCYGLVLISNSLPLLFFAMVIYGLGRAFSSGSIDALVIDEAVGEGRPVAQVTARLSILESSGLAIGALAGGGLAVLGSRYEGNLIGNLFLYALMFFLALRYVNEQAMPSIGLRRQDSGKTGGVMAQIKDSLAFIAQKGLVRQLLVFSFVTGFALLSLETYWQPALSELSPGSWVFGVFSFAGFFCVILGSRLAERWLARGTDGSIGLLLGLKALFGYCLMLLFFQIRLLPFMAVYLLVYSFLGGGSVAESTLLNQVAPPSQRASILSLFSFVLQLGGLTASLSGYVISRQAGFRSIWLVGGGLLLLGAGLGLVFPSSSGQTEDSF